MINLLQELQKFKYIDLENLNEKDCSDNVKNSIRLYNKALDSLRMKSEDIAIIELKKALSINPDFFEAMNLLGLCYMYTNQNSKAAELFEKVIAAGKSTQRTFEYLNMIKADIRTYQYNKNDVAEKSIKTIQKQPNYNTLLYLFNRMINAFKNGIIFKLPFIKYVACFAAGVVIVISAIVLMGLNNPVSKDVTSFNNIESSSNSITKSAVNYEAKYNEMKINVDKLKSDLEGANKTIAYYKNYIKLLEAENLAVRGNVEEAADILMLLKTVEFNEPEKDKFNNLYNQTVLQAVWKVYYEGCNLFYTKRYQEALNKLSKIPVYVDKWDNMPQTLYYIGICYRELNDYRNAAAAFKKVINDYPDSEYAQYSDYRIKELSGQP